MKLAKVQCRYLRLSGTKFHLNRARNMGSNTDIPLLRHHSKHGLDWAAFKKVIHCINFNRCFSIGSFFKPDHKITNWIQINHQLDATVSPVYYPDVYLQLNMFRTSSRPSSRDHQQQSQPLTLPLERGGSSAVGRGRADRLLLQLLNSWWWARERPKHVEL
jgi:hypothetical protein